MLILTPWTWTTRAAESAFETTSGSHDWTLTLENTKQCAQHSGLPQTTTSKGLPVRNSKRFGSDFPCVCSVLEWAVQTKSGITAPWGPTSARPDQGPSSSHCPHFPRLLSHLPPSRRLPSHVLPDPICPSTGPTGRVLWQRKFLRQSKFFHCVTIPAAWTLLGPEAGRDPLGVGDSPLGGQLSLDLTPAGLVWFLKGPTVPKGEVISTIPW